MATEPVDQTKAMLEDAEFKKVYFTIVTFLDLPEDDDPYGPCDSPDDPDDTHIDFGLDFNRLASTGTGMRGDQDLRDRLATFIDPTLTFEHCLASMHGVLAHLARLDAHDLQQAKDGIFRARRLVRQHCAKSPAHARNVTTRVAPALDEYRAQVHRIEDRINNIRLRTPVATPWVENHPADEPVPPGANAWSVLWHLCVAHSLGGPAGQAIAREILDPPFSPAQSLSGLTEILASLRQLDPAERSQAFTAMDYAKRYFYPVPTP